MLDASSARVRLLVAPAGYGKTTLAREWLAGPLRRSVWYRGEAASADVAALAVGIAEAANEIVVNAGKRMRDRIGATGNAEDDVEILAELFAEDVQSWPPDAWLALDDYQFAAQSAASEQFVYLLSQLTPIQVLITSRRRPSWATARRILYGEIQEIDRRALAMEDREAKAVLGREGRSIEELLVRAGGWPAVIGLAALTDEFDLPAETLPATLHTYFAEEVLQAADTQTRQELSALAIVPSISHQLISALLGDERADEVLDVGMNLGVLNDRGDDVFAFHPLIREFLLEPHLGEECHSASPARIGNYLLNHAKWDHAFEVACRGSSIALAERTIEKGLAPRHSRVKFTRPIGGTGRLTVKTCPFASDSWIEVSWLIGSRDAIAKWLEGSGGHARREDLEPGRPVERRRLGFVRQSQRISADQPPCGSPGNAGPPRLQSRRSIS